MIEKNKISVVISAFNEDKKIEKCLKSIKDFADEIIFVDNGSTDDTVKIASKFTDKIFIQKNDPFNIDIQKNKGIKNASMEWVLVLDADEVLSDDLKKEINIILKKSFEISDPIPIDGYMIPRKNIIFGKWISHTGWYPDYQLRLFRNGLGLYDKKHVHEPLNVRGKIEKLNEHIIHYNYETVSQFLYKHFQLYAPNEAEELLKRGYKFDWKGAVRMPMSEFLSRYFARQGYKDGFHGLILSLLMGFYHLSIFIYLWEKEKFKEIKEENIILGLEEEIKKTGKEFNYWLNTGKLEEEKSMLRRTTLKLKRKLNI